MVDFVKWQNILTITKTMTGKAIAKLMMRIRIIFILIHLYHGGRYIRKGGGATSGLIGTDTEVPFLLRNILGHQMRMKLLIDNNSDENHPFL